MSKAYSIKKQLETVYRNVGITDLPNRESYYYKVLDEKLSLIIGRNIYTNVDQSESHYGNINKGDILGINECVVTLKRGDIITELIRIDETEPDILLQFQITFDEITSSRISLWSALKNDIVVDVTKEEMREIRLNEILHDN